MSEVAKLVPSKPDAERAEEIKERTREALAVLVKVMDDAKADGFTVTFSINTDQIGRNTVNGLQVAKVY